MGPQEMHVIAPSSGVGLRLGEIWRHRELLWLLAWRDVSVRYKQTLLGVGWAILQPVLTIAVFSLFFGRLAGLRDRTGGIPYPVYVGDLAFQRKCLGRMGEAARSGRTVLFVSHNMGMIQLLCARALLLERGRLVANGTPAPVIQRYLENTLGAGSDGATIRFEEDFSLPFQLLSATLCDGEARPKVHFDVFENPHVRVRHVVRESIAGTPVQLCVYQLGDLLFMSWDTDTSPALMEGRASGHYHAELVLPAPLLKAGHYQLRFGMGIARVRSVHNPDSSLTLSVVEQTVGTNSLSYSADREGRLVVPLAWRTDKLA